MFHKLLLLVNFCPKQLSYTHAWVTNMAFVLLLVKHVEINRRGNDLIANHCLHDASIFQGAE